MTTSDSDGLFRILCLDGGGAKGFYTLGILDEIEKNSRKPIHQSFDLIFGTSTGAIIATLLARGDSVADAIKTYAQHVPTIMRQNTTFNRTKNLHSVAAEVFSSTKIDDFRTRIGIVATNWHEERPMIFKALRDQAHGSIGSFVPFFGCSVTDAVIASCSAYPFFETYKVTKSNGDIVELGDGGFCANNPTLYAIADALKPLAQQPSDLRVVSIGVGCYPTPHIVKRIGRAFGSLNLLRAGVGSDFLQKILNTNTTSMDTLRNIIYKDVQTIRINDTFAEPALATDLLEHDLVKLNRLTQKGRLSYQRDENKLKEYLNY